MEAHVFFYFIVDVHVYSFIVEKERRYERRKNPVQVMIARGVARRRYTVYAFIKWDVVEKKGVSAVLGTRVRANIGDALV